MDDPNNYYYDPSKSPRRKNSKAPIAILTIASIIGSLLVGYFIGRSGAATGVVPFEPVTNSTTSSASTPQVSADWSKLNQIKKTIYDMYDGPIDENKLLEGAIKGMVAGLNDPYSQFYNAKDYSTLKEQSTGKFIGVGIQVGTKDGSIIVIAPIEGGPAKEAGIISGDIIYKVDDKIYTANDMDAAITHMRGNEGKPVKITVKRDNKELSFTVVRREITMAPVKTEMLDNNIGLITLTQFTKDSDKLFKQGLDKLKAEGAKGYIIDFRGNPGGYLNESINMASNFIEKGKVVVSTMDKNKRKLEDKSKGGNYIGVPLAVLIDGGSASASEVVSGALRDHGAAVLVGVKSFGKGIVQQIMDLPAGEGLKLTIAAYYSPNGTNIHKIGIVPDFTVELPKDLNTSNYTKDKDTQLQKAIEEVKKKIGN